MEPRIEKLRRLVRVHGENSLQRHLLLTQAGRALVEALNEYLSPGEKVVQAVPAEGPWDPGMDYGQAAFSSFGRGRLDMEPLRMGLAVRLDGKDEAEAFWVRLAVALDCLGPDVTVDVPSAAEDVRVPAAAIGAAQMQPVCEAIEAALSRLFEDSCADRRGAYDGGRIGFVLVKGGEPAEP